MAAGLRDADRGPRVSGRASTDWKYRYNAIVRSRSRSAGLYFTRVRIVPRLVCECTCSKFDVLQILHTRYVNIRSLYFHIWELRAKYAKICTIRKFTAIRYFVVVQPKPLVLSFIRVRYWGTNKLSEAYLRHAVDQIIQMTIYPSWFLGAGAQLIRHMNLYKCTCSTTMNYGRNVVIPVSPVSIETIQPSLHWTTTIYVV